MYFIFALCYFALALADQEAFKRFQATEYYKLHSAVSLSCYNNKFEGAACKKPFLNFAPSAIDADSAKYYGTEYCLKNKKRCTKCANALWKKGLMKLFCKNAQKALLNLYSPYVEEVETPVVEEPAPEPEVPEQTEPEVPEEPEEPEPEVQTFPPLKDGLAQDPMSFYKAVSVGKGKPVAKLGTTGVSLYDGLPWEADGAYELDNDRVRDYEKAILNKAPSFTIAIDNHCQKANQNIDGVLAADVAALPILAFREIDDAGVPRNWNLDTRPRKLAAILKKKSDGETFYLPCTCSKKGDAKGHTWPGGVAQTFLSNSRQKKNAWKFDSDGGHIKGTIINTTIKSLSAIRKGYSTVKYGKHYVSVQINLELNSKFFEPLNKSYKLAGFVGWKQ